jgi:hypothetical protein
VELMMSLGVLGLAVGVASLLSHHRLKALSIVATVAGALIAAGNLALILLA